jgi:uridine kinase
VQSPEAVRSRVVAQLAELIVAVERSHPVRVAIDGRSAAGKSTLGDQLVAPIRRRGHSVIRASIDDFYCLWVHKLSRRHLSAGAFYSSAYDYAALRSLLLESLGPAGARWYRTRWHDGWNEGEIDEPERMAPEAAVLIVDGVFLLRPELNRFWDVRIFVDIDAEQSLERGVERDLTLDEPVVRAVRREQRLQVYRERYLPAEELYLREVNPMALADIVVDNRDLDVPRLIVRRRPA